MVWHMNLRIPFNRPYFTGREIACIEEAHSRGQLAGDGYFSAACSRLLETLTGTERALLTTSATSALEIAALLARIRPGDEVIMPSYTFVSTANAFVLRGGVPVFVDVRPDTLNIDENLIEAAITPKTRAIVPVHYAGVACEMDAIMDIARKNGLLVIEDAAQGILSRYKGTPLGTIGDVGCYSFHETKNITCGEGGAILVNRSEFVDRAEILREKGTDRSRFFRGQVDKYSWVDIGSSYLPGELSAAFLYPQLQDAQEVTRRRLEIWARYRDAFRDLAMSGAMRLPQIPEGSEHNAHMFYALLEDLATRSRFIEFMKDRSIGCVFHYVPLHNSSMGLSRGRAVGNLRETVEASDRLVRFPLWLGVEPYQQEVIDATLSFFGHKG